MLKIALVSCDASPLAVAASFDCDSPGLYLAQLGSELGALGCQVDIFTRRDRIEQPQVQYWRPNVRVIHVPAGPPGMAAAGRIQPQLEQFGRFMVGFARRQRGGYDIAHACDLVSASAAQQLRRTLGVPYVVSLQGTPSPAAAPAAVPAAELHQQLLADADRVLVRCRQQRDALQVSSGTGSAHIDIVPCGFDPAMLWPVRLRARELLGLPKGAFLALHVGRLAAGHGVDTAIEGLAQLAGRHGVAARLLVVGAAAPGDPGPLPELQRLHELAQRLKVALMVAGPQPVAALRHWYSAADVCIASPGQLGGGMAVLGAMACATPVIGAEAVAAAEGSAGMVVDGETGYLVAPHDPAALAKRLAVLHADPVLARGLGGQGWRRAHCHYTWRSVARRLTTVYAQVLAGVAAELTVELAADLAVEVANKAGATAPPA